MSNPIQIIQGAQYGSEAKGAIAAFLAVHEKVDICVRTGATNAGHTVYYSAIGTIEAPGSLAPVKMQQLPVGWVNPDAALVLGAGSLIDPLILDQECEEVSRLTGHDVRRRLYIDPRAGLHLPAHAERSAASGRHVAMGATGKGCSEALIDRIRKRGSGGVLFGQSEFRHHYRITDTALMLNRAYDGGAKVQLEGTQGTLLDLLHGPYPYTTHKPTTPGQWMVECGLSPALATDIVFVVRTYPIRVAGNSGPMPNEISWPTMARGINGVRKHYGLPPIVDIEAVEVFEKCVKDVAAAGKYTLPLGSTGLDMHQWTAGTRNDHREALSNIHRDALDAMPESLRAELSKLFEMTTVTRKLRRVARLSTRDLKTAAMMSRPHRVAVTFMNYEFPRFWCQAPEPDLDGDILQRMSGYNAEIAQACGAPVTIMSFGPHSGVDHIIMDDDIDPAVVS